LIETNTSEELVSSTAFDIVENRVEPLPQSGASRFRANVEQGVMDTIAEAQLLRAICHGRCDQVENPAYVFEMSRRNGADWPVLRSLEDSAWSFIDLPADDISRVQDQIANGYVALVPRQPLVLGEREIVGWWRIDPVTGETLGLGRDGRGQAMIDYANVFGNVVGGLACSATFSLVEQPNSPSAQFGAMACMGGSLLAGWAFPFLGEVIAAELLATATILNMLGAVLGLVYAL
jgi:hypothetical protein